MSLRSKITWSMLLLILGFGSLASYTTYYFSKKEFTNQVSKDLHGNTVALSHEIYQIMRQSSDISKALANDSLVRNYLAKPNPSESEAEVILDEFQGYNLGDMYSAIYVLDTKGKAVISTDPRFIDEDYSFREYFISAIKGNAYSSTAIGVTSKELGYYFSSPVYSPKDDEKIIGVTVVKLKPTYVEKALLNHLSAGYHIYLTDRYGIIILPSDSDKYLHSLGQLDQKSLEELKNSNRYNQSEFVALDYQLFLDKILTGYEDSEIIKVSDDHDNREELIAISKVEEFPFYIMFEGDMDTIESFSIKSSAVIAGYVLVAALLSVIVILFIVQVFLSQQQVVEDKLRIKTQDLERLNKLMVGRELKMIELKQQLSKEAK